MNSNRALGSPLLGHWALPTQKGGHREKESVKSRRGQNWGKRFFGRNSETDRGDGECRAADFAAAIVVAGLRMDGMAERQWPVAGDELSQELGGAESEREHPIAGVNKAVCV